MIAIFLVAGRNLQADYLKKILPATKYWAQTAGMIESADRIAAGFPWMDRSLKFIRQTDPAYPSEIEVHAPLNADLLAIDGWENYHLKSWAVESERGR